VNDATVLTTHQLSKSYGSRPAVKHLDLDVRRGEIFGFLAAYGAIFLAASVILSARRDVLE
jgi:ABC-type uncharacterized transport system ATPase subunit